MAFQTVATAVLSVSTSAPTAQTAAAFAMLAWTPVGEVTNMGSVKGRMYNTSEHAPVSSAQRTEKKASFKLGNAEFQCAWDDADAGQIIIDAASKTNQILSFRYKKQDGAIRYFTGQIMQFVENNGGVDDIVQGAFTILRQTDSVDVAAA